VIARRWTGRVPAERSDEYLAYLNATGLKDYVATPGHLGTTVLRRTVDGITEFELTTFWESTDAIRAFAGDDISIARYYPEDEEFLLELNEHVEHWEVVASPA
jgi:heme-degrading monooxygenase HmoA